MNSFVRFTSAVVLLCFTALAQAGGHKAIMSKVDIPVDPAVSAGVIKTIKSTETAWNTQDYAKILDEWDEDQAFPTYLAEEQAQWFVGWDRLRAYLDPPRPNPAVEALRLEFYDIQVKQIAPDLAIAIWNHHFEMKIIGSNPIGEDVRGSGVFRKKGDDWKWIHYAESPKAAPVFLEDLMEKEVRDDWDEFYKEAIELKKEVWRKKREAQKRSTQ